MNEPFPKSLSGTILIADCGLAASPDLIQMLSAEGFGVSCGPAVVDLSATLPLPDVIVLSVPSFTATEQQLCQAWKQRAETAFIPIVVLGADLSPAPRLMAFDSGVADYILFTLGVEEIVARLRVQVNTYALLRRLQRQTQRAIASGGPTQLLSDLQRALRRQAELLQAQNDKLHQEMKEREQAQEALRLEQQKSEQLLLNILPKAIVEKLKQLQGSLADRFDDVTILFADIVNFTPLAAQTSPLSLVNWLNQVFSEFDRLADRYQLEKIKTIGDAYMVVGGLPLPSQDHAEAVMEMALAMQIAAAGMARSDGQAFQLRIGINTGAVVAGVIGIKKFSYDLWGDAVNIASRMESQGQPGKIQVTEETYRRVKHLYHFEAAGRVLVKGRGYLKIYHYVGRR
ncbi:adenylate/guanylate cyclase domain-containing response regulator [Leptolyngbya sp. BL0902]|uniref:adenylate/guanylate cyclase domain-containing protein n=1 Tax=Leptolyngbya sp. BL0902 TaxID=1115757 RepID=UPI0018E8329B|nr:adenylate/guanylate cyclase domain-containing protein [Leptolyngbya sp. BL0902]QQE64526.1 adenylate/guanylate cyclase domain-containing response regulator [Leptolyngbya sp. BL0902]